MIRFMIKANGCRNIMRHNYSRQVNPWKVHSPDYTIYSLVFMVLSSGTGQ